jgi:hypothetical protein
MTNVSIHGYRRTRSAEPHLQSRLYQQSMWRCPRAISSPPRRIRFRYLRWKSREHRHPRYLLGRLPVLHNWRCPIISQTRRIAFLVFSLKRKANDIDTKIGAHAAQSPTYVAGKNSRAYGCARDCRPLRGFKCLRLINILKSKSIKHRRKLRLPKSHLQSRH